MEVSVELKFSRFTSLFPFLSSPKHFLLYVFYIYLFIVIQYFPKTILNIHISDPSTASLNSEIKAQNESRK